MFSLHTGVALEGKELCTVRTGRFQKTLLMLALWYMLYKPHKHKLLGSITTRKNPLKPIPGPTVDRSLVLGV